jgi:hypothetical protein
VDTQLFQSVQYYNPATGSDGSGNGYFELRFYWRIAYPPSNGGCTLVAYLQSRNSLQFNSPFIYGGPDTKWQEEVILLTVPNYQAGKAVTDTLMFELSTENWDGYCTFGIDGVSLTGI